MLHFIVLIISVFITGYTHAQSVISVPADNEILRFYSGVEVAIDRQGTATIDEVIGDALSFKETQLPFGGGYTRNTHWFRFTLKKNKTAQSDWLLVAGPGYIDRLELYSPPNDERSGYTMIATGDSIPARMIPLGLQYGSHTFSIKLDDEDPHTFYLKMKSHNTSALHLKLVSAGGFSETNSVQMLFSGFIIGALLLIMISAINACLWLNKPLYLLIVIYAAGAVLVRITLDGLIPQYLFPDSPVIVNMLAPMGTSLQTGSLMTFFVLFYKTAKNFPRLHYLFVFIIFLSISTLLSIPFDHFVTLAPYMLMTALVLFPIMLYIAWKGTRLKILGSRTVFVGYSIYLCLVTTTILGTTGIITAYPIMLEIPQIASLVFLLSMQQGMHRQLNQFEKVKLRAQSDAKKALKKVESEKNLRRQQSTFMTMVAHEIQTPLSVIDSAIQTIAMTKPELGSLISERHGRIQRSVRELNELLENTLAAESEKTMTLHPEIKKIKAENFIQMEIGKNLSKADRVQLAIFPDCIISADPVLLKHILSNLLVNAEKYSPENSTIHLTAEKKPVEHKPGILISIRNSHTSQKKPDPSRWLEKYFRQTDIPNINGFGLGLYLVEKITSAHQGQISIDIDEDVDQTDTSWLVSTRVWLPDIQIMDDLL